MVPVEISGQGFTSRDETHFGWPQGPIFQRLGSEVFTLVTGVRLPVGSRTTEKGMVSREILERVSDPPPCETNLFSSPLQVGNLWMPCRGEISKEPLRLQLQG